MRGKAVLEEEFPGARKRAGVDPGARRSGLWARWLWIALILGLVRVSVVARADDAPEEIDPTAPCVTSECHTEIADRDYLHWKDLAKPGECQKCHKSEDNAHEFDVDDSPAGCFGCHQELQKKMKSAETVHDPAQDVCTDCLDPLGGAVNVLLIDIDGDDISSLCFDCHEEEPFDKKYPHGPAQKGACNMCHDLHASSIDPLLRAERNELCLGCHDEMAEVIDEAEFVHDPVEDDCTNCHDPHSGPFPKMLFAEKRELCNDCHDDIVDTAQDSSVDHQAVLTKKECLNCHRPHGAKYSPMLKKAQPELCLGCHDKRLKSGDRRLVNMKSLLDKNEFWHKPIRKDGCTVCHQPHGGENFRMLEKRFPAKFYSAFDPKRYALCFSCHKREMVTAKRTRKLTNFRDGDRNLHFVHVDKKKRGRTCRACHDMHAAKNDRLIRERTRYGNWMMPIRYEKTETGGSCQPGCHKQKRYDRAEKDAFQR